MSESEVKPLPCPFCGSEMVSTHEGDGFRWRIALCAGCGARSGDVRVQTMGEGTRDEWMRKADVDAIAEWNKRDTTEVDRLRQTVSWLRGLIATVAEHMERDQGGGQDAPGHCHETPGVWDMDNRREIAGKPCEWCHIWAEFKAAGADRQKEQGNG